VRPAAFNTLTTYLLPDLWYFILAAAGIRYFDAHFNDGWAGVVQSGLFTAFILTAGGLFTRLGVRLRL
jgi:heparan-alpha-glucosaminide N-acetyltransferase